MNSPSPYHKKKGEEVSVSAGFLQLLSPDGSRDPARILRFQVNPESLSRQITVEQGTKAAGMAEHESSGRNQNRDGGELKESFKIQVRLDVSLVSENSGRRFSEGIAPELAALELALQPYEQWSPDGQAVVLRNKRPLLIFGWGERRFPVRLTGMTINETFHSRDLVPIRAEVELSLEVLRPSEIEPKSVRALVDELAAQRRRAAQRLWDPSLKGGF